jgi:hypothetical protein
MSERGAKQSMIDMAQNFCLTHGDKIILNRKGIDLVLRKIDQFKKDALKMRERGGLVLVDVENSMLTTYALDSFKR